VHENVLPAPVPAIGAAHVPLAAEVPEPHDMDPTA
jgi:hypothetical protein